MIPDKLKRDDLRFILVSGKSPYEKKWTTENNYRYDDPKIINHKGNLGVVCGYSNLAILDCDEQELKEVADKTLPPTFEVKTGSGGCHKYYFIEDLDKKIIFQNNKGHWGELQFKNTMCVAPNSIHPNGNKYQVVSNLDIASISKQDIIKGLFNYMSEKDIKKQVKLPYNNSKQEKYRTIVEEIKRKIKIPNLMSDYGYDLSKHPTVCKLGHSTKGKGNFSYNDEVYNCFHCGSSGDIFTFIEEHEKCDFKEALNILKKKAGIELTTEIKKETYNNLREDVIKLLYPKDKDQKPDKLIASELMVSAFLENNKVFSLRQDEKEEIWIYNKGIYEPNGISYIEEFVNSILVERYKKEICTLVADKIRVRSYISAEDFFNSNHKEYIIVENGIVNIKTRELKKYDKNMVFFQKMPVIYNDDLKEPRKTINFLKEILENEEDIKLIQEFFGYCLLKDYPIEKAFMFLGKGRNGKSQLAELLENFVGSKNCKHFSLHDLCNDKFDISELQGKLMNISGEINDDSLTKTDQFKKLVGRDTLSANRKFKTSISFTNYAKLVFNCNKLPKPNDDSDGFWDRWVLINFPYRFEYQEIIDKMSYDEKKFCKPRKNNIIDEIMTKDEFSKILNWALDGLDRLLKQEHFTFTKSASNVKKRWKRIQNSFLAFCEENIKFELGYETTKSELRRFYTIYCKFHNISVVSDKIIKETLTEEYGITDGRSSSENRPMIWNNLKITSSELDLYKEK